MDKIKVITEVLRELRTAAASINSEENLKATMRKYDMLFVGEKFNTIYACELRHSLEKVFKEHISMPDLLDMIPDVCHAIGMEVDAMTVVDDPERKIADYQITLF